MSTPAENAVETVTIEIDGRSLTVPKNSMIIEAADAAGIPIPRFCYHRKLSVAANCRMCMVEVEKVPKPLPACATPVADGMKISTASDFAKAAQKAVMEFLLINHPLDCPICDQGGECELQDVALEYGRSVSRFSEQKRVVADKDIGPLIATDMTRCIHCTRCVRFMDEIAGTRELGGIGRGERTMISTCVERAIESELSGNIIDICPVGALTSKPFRFRARAWELSRKASVSPHDCIGSNTWLHTRRGKVMRAVPRDNESINEAWLSDRDRYSYQALESDDRLTEPMVKDAEGNWSVVDWDVALECVAGKLGNAEGAEAGFVVSPSATCEEIFLLSQIAMAMGCDNIDHRVRRIDFSGQDSDPLFPALGCNVEDLEKQDAVLLVGSNVRKEQPIAGHRIRKAALRGAKISAVNPVDYEFHFDLAARLISRPSDLPASLAAILKSLLTASGSQVSQEVTTLAARCNNEVAAKAIAESLREAGNGIVLLGPAAIAHPQYATLQTLAAMISNLAKLRFGTLSEGANSAGACLAGAVPHRKAGGGQKEATGKSAADMLSGPTDNLFIWGIEPERDCWDSSVACNGVRDAGFTIYAGAFVSGFMKEYADVLLPIAAWSETSGTWINAEGRWQGFTGAVAAPGSSRPGWKVLRVLANLMHLDGFGFNSSAEVLDAFRAVCPDIHDAVSVPQTGPIKTNDNSDGGSVRLERVGEVAAYGVDSIVRRAEALQMTPDMQDARCAHLSTSDAQRLGIEPETRIVVEMNGKTTTVPARVSDRVPDGAIWLQSGTPSTDGFGSIYGEIEVQGAPS